MHSKKRSQVDGVVVPPLAVDEAEHDSDVDGLATRLLAVYCSHYE